MTFIYIYVNIYLSKGQKLIREVAAMKYTLEHVQNVLGSFWVIYEDSDEYIQWEVFYSRDISEVLKVLRELRGE